MTITIEGLSFETIIGILDFERQTPQRVIVDCEISYEGEYVDYAVVRAVIIETMQEEGFGLIEDALALLIPKLHEQFPQINTLRLKIAKPDIFDDCVVGVEESVTF